MTTSTRNTVALLATLLTCLLASCTGSNGEASLEAADQSTTTTASSTTTASNTTTAFVDPAIAYCAELEAEIAAIVSFSAEHDFANPTPENVRAAMAAYRAFFATVAGATDVHPDEWTGAETREYQAMIRDAVSAMDDVEAATAVDDFSPESLAFVTAMNDFQGALADSAILDQVLEATCPGITE